MSKSRARFFGSNGLWILIAGVTILGFQVAALTARGAKLGPEAQLDAFSGFLIGLTIGIVVLAAWKLPSIARDRRLAKRYSGGIVLSAVRTPPLASALRALAKEGADWAVPLPTLFTVVATREALNFFATAVGSPSMSIDWPEIRGIQVGQVEESTRRSNALFIELETHSLPLVITGAGVAGLFPQSKATLELVKQQLALLHP